MWKAYTDGSASPNPGPGGAGMVILRPNGKIYKRMFYTGGSTTNNRMELKGVIMAVKYAPESLTIHTDSSYVKNGIETWSKNWLKNNEEP